MKALTSIVLISSLALYSGISNVLHAKEMPISQQIETEKTIAVKPASDLHPRIQVAILLDTSSSMDGLIDQTRNQIWQVINEFSSLKQNGVQPRLEVAVIEYGNNGNSNTEGYVRQVSAFTRELDKVSESLFSLRTNGGNEYCGYAIKTATESLTWSNKQSDLKTIFIAGNESFHQGPVSVANAVALAKEKGIVVNTIFAGVHAAGAQSGWQQAAALAGGDYLSINADRKVVHINAPQDKKIAELNQQLNQTYIPYGAEGSKGVARQKAQDSANAQISSGLMAKRAQSKSSSYYSNANWDLVDAVKEGKVDQNAVADLPEASLPAAMKKLTKQERKDFVQTKLEEREDLQRQIQSLAAERKRFVAEKEKNKPAEEASISDALISSVKKQAKSKAFEVTEEK